MSERCPFCDARDCDKHLLLCSDADEGTTGGTLYGEEEAWRKHSARRSRPCA